MDCDDVMLVLAAREHRTLTGGELAELHAHVAGCTSCRTLQGETDEDWRWVVRLPEEAFDDPDMLVLPVVDPVVFDVGEELASGGMGRITRAHDRRLGREVAIKEVLQGSMRARFEREATITARLQHPAIVPIYEAGTWPNGSAFYTMRLVDGGTLASAISAAETMAERVALLPHVLAVTEALAYAHARRIIHRDLKPGNVLVGAFGETVVIDWGLAKELDRDDVPTVSERTPNGTSAPDLTRAGAVLGTPGFMSPEQARGEELDERADVYALGALLYNVLTGLPPYYDRAAGETPDELVERACLTSPTPLGELAPDAPADLRAIAERAMARDKADRYRDAKEMADELRRFEAGQLIASREYRMRDLLARWIRRHRTAVTVGSIAFVLLAVIGVLAIVGIARSREAEQVSREAAESTTLALLEEQARVELLAGDRERGVALLAEAYRRGRDTPALHYLLAVATRDLAPLRTTIQPPQLSTVCGKDPNCAGTDVSALGYDATGKLVLVESTGRITRWDNGVRVQLVKLGLGKKATVGPAILDANATTAYLNGVDSLEAWDVTRGVQKWRVFDSSVIAPTLALDPAGKLVIALSDDDEIKGVDVRDAATGAIRGALDINGGHVTHVAFSADGTQLAACAKDGSIRIFETAGLTQTAAWQFTREPLALAFAGNDRLVIGAHNTEIWRISSAARIHTLVGHRGELLTIAANPSGELIVTGDDATVRLWTARGEMLGESREPHGRLEHFRFVGDTLIGSGLDDRVFIWDLPALALRDAISAHDGWTDQFALDRTGTRLATSGFYDQRVFEWAMPTGDRLARVPARSAAFAGDRWIVLGDAGVDELALDGSRVTRHFDLPLGDHPKGRLVASRDGTRIMVVVPDHTFVVDRRTSSTVTLETGTGEMLSADGRFVIDIHDDERERSHVRVFDAATGHLVLDHPVDPKEQPLAEIAPDGSRVIIGSNRVEQLRVPSGEPLAPAALLADKNASYDPHFDATASRYTVVNGVATKDMLVFDAATGHQVSAIHADRDVTTPVFSPDGRYLLTHSENRARLWSVATGALLGTIQNATYGYAFTPDSALFATGANDGSVSLWDTDTRRLLATFRGHREPIVTVEISADGDRLLAASKDGYASLWDIHRDRRSPGEITVLAERAAWRFENGLLVARQ